jgi:membrane protein implicated in regulation of membrane protease activity
VYAGYGLLKRRDRSVVRRAQVVLWVIGPIASLIIGLVLPAAVVGDVDVVPEFIGSFIVSVLAAFLWTAYLSRSRRVKATYAAVQAIDA